MLSQRHNLTLPLQIKEREEKIAREKAALEAEYDKRMQELKSQQEQRSAAKGSSRLNFTDVWEIKVSEVRGGRWWSKSTLI